MKKDGNWVKVYRSVLELPFWNEKPFSEGQAWIDLLLTVHWASGVDYIGSHKRRVKRGQLWTSRKMLGERWGWHKEKVGRFLNKLECVGLVSVSVSAYGSMITLKNQDVEPCDVSADVSGSVSDSTFPSINNKNKEREEPVPCRDEDDEGMTEEEWNELLRIQG